MNLDHLEGAQLARNLCDNIGSIRSDIDIVLCPSFTSLQSVSEILKNCPEISLGAQNVSWEKAGAFTGEISIEMLKPLDVKYVIVGHSERRHILKETDDSISKKVRLLVDEGLRPILCVGETLEQRQAGQAKKIIEDQIYRDLSQIDLANSNDIIIAYEPVWAIGTGQNATSDDAAGIIRFIRDILGKHHKGVANKIRIQYGGSVTSDNIDSFMEVPDIDGVLVGGASLKLDQFLKILKFNNNKKDSEAARAS